MNEQILENLLIDRALGQLSPDVAALLDDYLAHNPAAMPFAAELDDTVALAGQVLRQSPPSVKAPIHFEALPSHTPLRFPLAMAASFIIGVGMTFLLLQDFQIPSHPASQPQLAEQPAAETLAPESTEDVLVNPAARSLPFWSRERARLLAQHPGAHL